MNPLPGLPPEGKENILTGLELSDLLTTMWRPEWTMFWIKLLISPIIGDNYHFPPGGNRKGGNFNIKSFGTTCKKVESSTALIVTSQELFIFDDNLIPQPHFSEVSPPSK